MKTLVKVGLYFSVWLCFCATVRAQPVVNSVDISPSEPVNGENATLTCMVADFDSTLHQFMWKRDIDEKPVDVSANERIKFNSVEETSGTSFSQTMALTKLEEADEGQYYCVVVEKSTGISIGVLPAYLHVSYPDEFPICVPEGAAKVQEGDRLSCRTLIDAQTPDVRDIADPVVILNWAMASLGDDHSGRELRSTVTAKDDGVTYRCYSLVVNDTKKALSCRIGPLTVEIGPTTITPEQGLPTVVIIAIAVGGFLVLLFLFICALCCLCNARNGNSYLFTFTGIFGRPKTQTKTDTAE